MGGGKCAVCNATAGQQCAGCKVVYYCGRDHQRADWSKHKYECKPITLSEDPILGRHYIASRNISPGEIIIKESPVVTDKVCEDQEDNGPKIISKPVCLGCLKPANINCKCSGCGWPLCETKCQNSAQHIDECKLMQSEGFKANITDEDRRYPDYVCIAPLRVLLMPEDKRRKVLQLQSHLNERKNSPLYNLFKINVVSFIRDRLKLHDKYTEDEILEICAIFDTNAFEVKPFGGIKVRGLFLSAAMMAHDCTPNTRHTFDENNTIYVYATKNIEKGQSITTSYTQVFWSTTLRRLHLKNTKCFECYCSRCNDPTEFGTYVSSILCTKCNGGKLISTNSLNEAAKWNCNSCEYTITGKQIEWGNQSLREEINKLNKSGPHQLEEFLIKYKNVLHPTNEHALQVKYALTEIYGDAPGYLLADLNDNQLERKIELCHELLEVVEILEPGSSRIRAQLLFALQSAMAVQAKNDYEDDKITKERAQETLEDSMKLLEEATFILRTEPGMEKLLQERISQLATELEIVLEQEKSPEPVKPNKRLTHQPATATNDDE